jgi:hypothetical protein
LAEAAALYSLGFLLVLLRLSPRMDWRPLDRVVSRPPRQRLPGRTVAPATLVKRLDA